MTDIAHLKSTMAKIIIFTVLAGMMLTARPAFAGDPLTTVRDTQLRIKVSTASQHSISFNIPAGVDIDTTTNNDEFIISFDIDDKNFDSNDATWVAGDFNISATGSSTWAISSTVVQGAGTQVPDCGGATAGKWAVSVSTDNDVFRFKACDLAADPSDTGAEVLIDIDYAADNGLINNPSVAEDHIVSEISMTADGVAAAHLGQFATSIVDDDQVLLSGTVDPQLSFDIDTSITDGQSATPYSVSLGRLTSSTLSTSNHSTIKSIFIDIGTNAEGGGVVFVRGANTGLYSTTTTTTIDPASSEETIAAGEEEVGLCVESVTATTGTLVAGTQYDANGAENCTVANGGTPRIGKISTGITGEIMFTTSSAPIAGGRGEILVKASVSATTPAANDYSNTLTFIASGIF